MFNVNKTSKEMFEIYQENSFEQFGKHGLTAKGMAIIHVFFESIPDEWKEEVFDDFLISLEDSNIVFDKEQFAVTVH